MVTHHSINIGRYCRSAVAATLYLLMILSFSSCSATTLQLSAPGGQAESAEDVPLHPELQPNAQLSPDEVVKIQVEALQNNDENDNGIEITFRFASPANKQVTGPLFRFKELVKNPDYRAMLNHKIAEYGPLEIDGDTASQRVTVIKTNGEATVFLFSLSRQNTAACPDCWMTDGVTIVPTRKQRLQGI